jgi:hypothetical protein
MAAGEGAVVSAYRFSWSSYVTAELIGDLTAASGVAADAISAIATVRLARLFELTGGLPIVERRLAADERIAVARRILHESVMGALGARTTVPDGFAFEDEPNRRAKRVRAVSRVAVNVAAQSELEALPTVGRVIARRIVDARVQRPFRDTTDLAERIAGLSLDKAHGLASLLRFDVPGSAPANTVSGDLRTDLARLIGLRSEAEPAARVLSTLDALVARAGGNRHPMSGHVRALLPAPESAFIPGDVELLYGRRYYAELPGLLRSAQRRIDVCMFHIALTSPGHPTRRLLEALRDRKRAGTSVRVLVDRDRNWDPYASRAINQPAIDYLRDAGIRVRVDPPGLLLHSKIVVIDDAVVVGSHNWTAGSYFSFDDLSVVIRSVAVRRAQSRRFAALWATGTNA